MFGIHQLSNKTPRCADKRSKSTSQTIACPVKEGMQCARSDLS